MAILRVLCPHMLIPTTSSLELLARDGQYLGLLAGANAVTLHDGTPRDDENKYIIYRQDRYKPRDILFKVVKKAKLVPSPISLIREKRQNTLFYKLVNKNLGRNKTAVYFEGREYTYEDLFALSSKFSLFLEDNKIKEGQMVLLAVFDSIEFIVAILSCIRMGIVVAIADPQLARDELISILSHLRPRRILSADSFGRRIKDKRILKITDDDSSDYFFSTLKRYPVVDRYAGTDKNNPAIILYTSGTTGKPKGVVHTHQDLFVDNFPRAILKITGKDTVFSCSKLYTSFGLGNSFLFPFHLGAGVILSRDTPNAFSIQKILKLRPTLFFAVPSMYEFLAKRAEIPMHAFGNIRLFIASGEKLYSSVFQLWNKVYKKKLVECYGSTEMCHPFISNAAGKVKSDSCGKVIEGFRIKFDKDRRLCYKGPSLFKGYYGDFELTRKKLCGGWFESDDTGYMNRKGYVFIKGRNNLVFKLGGKWVSILDIEDKLRKCGLIEEVVVVKKENGLEYYLSLGKKMGSDIAHKRIRRFCMNNLSMHELPKKINIVGKIPKTRSGKIIRERVDEKC